MTSKTPPAMPIFNTVTKSVSMREYDSMVTLYERAAEKAGKSFSDWARDNLRECAAMELGESLPSLPPLERGRYGGLIARAAKEMGVSRDEFLKRAGETFAAAHFGFADKPSQAAQAPKVRQLKERRAESSTQVRAAGHR